MYTLLLVDDEEEVTRIIAKKVKWNDLGFSVTGHANNGLNIRQLHNKSAENYNFLHFCCAIGKANQMKMSS